MKRLVVFAGLAALLWSTGASAQVFQRVPFGSTPNPVGSGARAVGWAGAYIAVADDATAASWNPAGLIQLVEPEASVALTYHSRVEQFTFDGFDTQSDGASLSGANLNYASLVYPFHIGEVNMVTSLNYQRLYEFDRSMDYTSSGTNGLGEEFVYHRKFDQSGALSTITPAFAIQVTPAWSMGLSVNLWGLEDSGNGWHQQFQTIETLNPGAANQTNSWGENREEYTFTGTNFVIGTHYKIQNLTIGAVYKTSFEADVKYKAQNQYSSVTANNPGFDYFTRFNQNEDQTITWPESYGVGLAWRYSDRLSFSLDGYSTRWSRYVLHGSVIDPTTKRTENVDLNLITGDESTNVTDTWQVRAGAEYLWIQPKFVFALRGGAFYDPEPMAKGVSEFYGAAVGGGLVYRNFVVDAAIQARFAQDIPGERVESVQSKTDNQDYFGIVSLIYHF